MSVPLCSKLYSLLPQYCPSNRTEGDALWCLVSLFQVAYKHSALKQITSWFLYLAIRPLAYQIVVLSVQPTVGLSGVGNAICHLVKGLGKPLHKQQFVSFGCNATTIWNGWSTGIGISGGIFLCSALPTIVH